MGLRVGVAVAAFAAEPTIGIARGLLGFVEAIRDVSFRIVLFDPRQDMFGIERNTLHGRRMPRLKFGEDQAHTVGQ